MLMSLLPQPIPQVRHAENPFSGILKIETFTASAE